MKILQVILPGLQGPSLSLGRSLGPAGRPLLGLGMVPLQGGLQASHMFSLGRGC